MSETFTRYTRYGHSRYSDPHVQETLAKARPLADGTRSVKQVAALLGIPRGTIGFYGHMAKLAGEPLNFLNTKKESESKRAEVRKLILEGNTATASALLVGVNVTTAQAVRTQLVKEGLVQRGCSGHKRVSYICSRCGVQGHNKQTCPERGHHV